MTDQPKPAPAEGDALREAIIDLVGKHFGPYLGISPTPRYEAIVKEFAYAVAAGAAPQPARDAAEGAGELPVYEAFEAALALAEPNPAPSKPAPDAMREAHDALQGLLAWTGATRLGITDSEERMAFEGDLKIAQKAREATYAAIAAPVPPADTGRFMSDEAIKDAKGRIGGTLAATPENAVYQKITGCGVDALDNRKEQVSRASPVPPADGAGEPFKTCTGCEMRRTCADMKHCYGPSHAELKERFVLSPSPAVAAEPAGKQQILSEARRRYEGHGRLLRCFAEGAEWGLENRPAPPVSRDREAIAAFLIAMDDAEFNKPIPQELLDYGAMLIRTGVDAEHSGDCTKECHSCHRCGVDRMLLWAGQLRDLLSLPVQSGAGEREAVVRECAAVVTNSVWGVASVNAQIAKEVLALSRQPQPSSSGGAK